MHAQCRFLPDLWHGMFSCCGTGFRLGRISGRREPCFRIVILPAQVMGPGDTYLLHHELNIDTFWADKRDLALGASFQAAAGARGPPPKQMVSQVVHHSL